MQRLIISILAALGAGWAAHQSGFSTAVPIGMPAIVGITFVLVFFAQKS